MSQLAGVEMYKLIQTDAGSYELHLVSRRPDTERLTVEAVSILKKLYGLQADIIVIQDTDIAPEISGKYLVSRTTLPIDLEDYLDVRYIGKKRDRS